MRGETVYVGDTAVDNVLVSSGGVNKGAYDAVEKFLPIGPVADYTLYFPMSYTGDLSGRRITVRGIECDVIGHPDHERPDQVFGSWLGSWDMAVHVKRTLPGYNERIIVKRIDVSRDEMGARTERETTVYEGAAQVRFIEGNEKDEHRTTISRETYAFVFPWQSGLAGVSTQTMFIDWNGSRWDVQHIENVDEKSETASIEAVRHD